MNEIPNKNIGILSIQGSFAEHAQILDSMGVPYILVRSKKELENLTHLIMPGGESTTIEKLLREFEMWDVLSEKVNSKKLKVFGTCAGAIILSRLGLNITVERNGYGSQLHSFSSELTSDQFPNLRGVFIRAPYLKVMGDEVKILATHESLPVLVEQDNMLAASFHPELAGEKRIYEYFLK